MVDLQLIWGWQPASYLFFGGMSSGAFVTSAVLFLINRDCNKKIINVSMWTSAFFLAVGLLLLLSELVHPLRGMLLWQSFSNGTSWMTAGAWAVLIAVIIFVATALLTTEKVSCWVVGKWKAFGAIQRRLLTILASIGIVLGVFVAVYTGLLLMSAPGAPLWNTLFLPCLFTVSAFDTGVALVEINSYALRKQESLTPKAHNLLGRSVIILVLFECLVLITYIGSMILWGTGNDILMGSSAATATLSAEYLVSGTLAPFFWVLVVFCGLAIPLICSIASLRASKKKHEAKSAGDSEVNDGLKEDQKDSIIESSQDYKKLGEQDTTSDCQLTRKSTESPPSRYKSSIVLVGAIGALVGGCALRFIILASGLHADLVSEAFIKLFSS